MAIASRQFMSWIAWGATGEVIEAAVVCLKVVAFAFALNAIVDYLGFVLAAHLRFALAAAAPAANALTGGLFLYTWPEWGIYNLIWGTLLGILVQINRSGIPGGSIS